MYTLLFSKWVTNKDLLYSIWNSTQCYVPAWIEGVFWGKRYMYMYGWVPSLFTSAYQILLISYVPIQNKKFKVWKRRREKQRRERREGGHVTIETDFGVTQPHVTEYLGHQKLEEARNAFILFYDPSEAVQPSQHFDFKLLVSRTAKE